MSSFLSFDKKRIIFKAFFESQFKYCPLVWMFHGREVNQRINRLHERALSLVYNDYCSTFEHLLEKDDSCTVHHSNPGADPGSVSVGVRLTYFRRPKMVFSTSVVLNER